MNLKELRLSKNLTQHEMSEILTKNGYSIKQTGYSRIENGKRVPSYDFLKILQKSFPDVNIGKMFFDE